MNHHTDQALIRAQAWKTLMAMAQSSGSNIPPRQKLRYNLEKHLASDSPCDCLTVASHHSTAENASNTTLLCSAGRADSLNSRKTESQQSKTQVMWKTLSVDGWDGILSPSVAGYTHPSVAWCHVCEVLTRPWSPAMENSRDFLDILPTLRLKYIQCTKAFCGAQRWTEPVVCVWCWSRETVMAELWAQVQASETKPSPGGMLPGPCAWRETFQKC